MEKILNAGARICLFCGKPPKSHWDDCEEYFECDCEDAVETRRIKSEIEALKRKLPKEKFSITKESVLRKLSK